jgi:hypothetical protein
MQQQLLEEERVSFSPLHAGGNAFVPGSQEIGREKLCLRRREGR